MRTLENHMKCLSDLLGVPVDIELMTALCEIEEEGHRAAEKYCNGEMNGSEHTLFESQLGRRFERLTRFDHYHLNSDPRGFFLKIEADYMRNGGADSGLETDWGGYGIVAPEWVVALINKELIK